MRYSTNRSMTPEEKLRLAAYGLLAVLLVGTFGFMYLEHMSPLDSLYMTVITLSTVGFGEVNPLHSGGRTFVIFLIVFGVALAGFTFSVIGQMVLEGQIREIFGRRKMDSRIRKMTGHYIIAGYGRVGRHVASEFQRRGVSFVVVERDDEAISQLVAEHIPFVQGDSTDEDALRSAGLESASTLISTLPDEAQNVYLTLTARDMNKKLKIIARADLEGGEKKLVRAGADHVVTPHILGGMRMAMASLRPNVVDFMQMTSLGEGGLSIEELMIPANCRLSGKTLVESNIKQDYGVTIIGIKQKNKQMIIAPEPGTVLSESDILVLIGPMDSLERLGKSLN
jgi:voltage-gated potassium channel